MERAFHRGVRIEGCIFLRKANLLPFCHYKSSCLRGSLDLALPLQDKSVVPTVKGTKIRMSPSLNPPSLLNITVVFIKLKPENACDSDRNEQRLDGLYASKTNEGHVQGTKLSETTFAKASVAFPGDSI